MSSRLIKEGGELNATRVGSDEYQLKIDIPHEGDGRIARECHKPDCSPGYFKVMPGTGITENYGTAYCPYCRHQDDPNKFYTSEQLRYAKDMVLSEVHSNIGGVIKDALGLGPTGKKTIAKGFLSVEMTYKEGARPIVKRPVEEEIRRDVICPHCGLDQSVYGLATWCADCGQDIFLTHVSAEFSVVRSMLTDIERRRELLGVRIAAKDAENCLEDTVSIFEAAQRAMARRYLNLLGRDEEDVGRFFKKAGNGFQNLKRAEEIYQEEFKFSLLDCLTEQESGQLALAFDKRHPITHNLGVVDRKYLERARSGEAEGREILVSIEDIEDAINLSLKIIGSIHEKLFDPSNIKEEK